MSIREVDLTETSNRVRKQRMSGLALNQDQQIIAEWSVELPNGQRRRVLVPVSPELNAAIIARPSFVAIVELITTDTLARTGAIVSSPERSPSP